MMDLEQLGGAAHDHHNSVSRGSGTLMRSVWSIRRILVIFPCALCLLLAALALRLTHEAAPQKQDAPRKLSFSEQRKRLLEGHAEQNHIAYGLDATDLSNDVGGYEPPDMYQLTAPTVDVQVPEVSSPPAILTMPDEDATPRFVDIDGFLQQPYDPSFYRQAYFGSGRNRRILPANDHRSLNFGQWDWGRSLPVVENSNGLNNDAGSRSPGMGFWLKVLFGGRPNDKRWGGMGAARPGYRY